jgi:hypothetical protein
VACLGQTINAYQVLNGKSEGKGPPGKPRHRPEGNIEMDLIEIRWNGVDCTHVVQHSNH